MADAADPVKLLTRAALPTRFGRFEAAIFADAASPAREVLVLMHGSPEPGRLPLVRLHSECLTGDVLGSMRCDCGEQLHVSLELIAEATHGVLLYLPQEGRGIGLANKIRAYALQDQGLDTVDANLALGLPVDRREYASAAAILKTLGLHEVRLLTNNPLKCDALERHGVRVAERVPISVPPNAINRGYLHTKANRMGHLLAFEA